MTKQSLEKAVGQHEKKQGQQTATRARSKGKYLRHFTQGRRTRNAVRNQTKWLRKKLRRFALVLRNRMSTNPSAWNGGVCREVFKNQEETLRTCNAPVAGKVNVTF